jgi:HSP20 family molecular chaperone IbpA
MSLVGEDPFAALMRLQRELDESSAGKASGTTTTGAGAFPPVNVFLKGDRFVAVAEAPGLDKEALDVEVRKNQLRLAGRRMVGEQSGSADYFEGR